MPNNKFDIAVLAANLRGERAKKGVTQSKAATDVGYSQAALQRWEAGETIPLASALFELADYYGTTIDQLCGYKPAA